MVYHKHISIQFQNHILNYILLTTYCTLILNYIKSYIYSNTKIILLANIHETINSRIITIYGYNSGIAQRCPA